MKYSYENRNAMLTYIIYELEKQFSELNSNANEYYAEWGGDIHAKENKKKQEEILMLLNELKNKL